MFSCCPEAATVVPSGREVISCPMCPDSVRDHVSVEWFQRLCRISGVQWPVPQTPVSVDCALCADVMSDDTSVQVFRCQQHLHISCLVRSFAACGFHCPFCSQSLSSFHTSAVLQVCLKDMDAQPSSRGSNSMVVPTGFPAPPAGHVFRCCPPRGPASSFRAVTRSSHGVVPDSGFWRMVSSAVVSSVLPHNG